MQVRFSDESTLYEFSVAGITVLSYAPMVGKRGEPSVTDTIEILISTIDADSQQSTKDEINNWLALAVEQWETVSESRIFIEIKQTNETDWRRSEMLGGRLRPNKSTLDSHSLHKQEYLLTVDRRNWWEWPEEEIELSYDNDHFATGGLAFLNDGGSCNFFGNIKGDPQTPIPVRLEFVPTDTSQYIDRIFIAHNVFSTANPIVDEHMLQAADALPDNTGVDMGDATNYNELDSSGGEMVYIEWDLDTTRLAGLGGRWFHLLGRIKTPSATTAVFGKFSLYSKFHVSELPMAVTEETLITSDTLLSYDLIDFGAMRLPTLAPSTTPAPLKMRFSARSSAAFTLWLDAVEIAPTDSFHHIETTYTSALNPEVIIADGRIGRTYMLTTEGGDTPIYTMDAFADVSPHLSVWPGRSQWFTVLHRNLANYMETGQELTARAYYRPRRTTV